MLAEIINTFAQRISAARFIEKVFGLGLIYRLKDSTEPVVFQNGQPLHINFDQYKSLCFFVLNGPVSQTQKDSDVSCGVIVIKKVPLRLVYFGNTETNNICLPLNDEVLLQLLGLLSLQDDKALRETFRLSAVSLQASSHEMRSEVVWAQIFGKLPYSLRENQQLFSLDFDLNLEGNPICWLPQPCGTDKALDDENLEPVLNTEGEIINYN